MKTTNNIHEKIDSTLSVCDTISEVNVSPFFKDQTMQRLFEEKEEETVYSSWFATKLQLATLLCFVVLNALALIRLNSTNKYDVNVNESTNLYGLFYDSETSILINLKDE